MTTEKPQFRWKLLLGLGLLFVPPLIFVADGWLGVPDTDVCGRSPTEIAYTAPCLYQSPDGCIDGIGMKQVGESAGMWGKFVAMTPDPVGWKLTYSHPVRDPIIRYVPVCPPKR
jgi:hypothetical protein